MEGLGKVYRLGEIGSNFLLYDVQRMWARLRGKDDPFLIVGTENDRTQKNNDPFAWALKDVNFGVNEGDAIGIIGKNGAGKSTLLKILSKVTSPTQGKVKVRGRIASLLEVGTGFHPDLTGRENIYLNGAILGMRKKEISAKFDEIVDFAGVERYIDTPVKRYSSGMYVRLAFAVAAHLEAEILIVDEVLAVGDAEFQRKCLGKMKDATTQGKTVLFVSHNITAISTLCQKGLVLQHGNVLYYGDIRNAINTYYKRNSLAEQVAWEGDEGDEHIRLLHTWVKPCHKEEFVTDAEIEIGIKINVLKPLYGLILGFTLFSEHGYELAYALFDDKQASSPGIINEGTYIHRFTIPANTLAYGTYRIEFDIGLHMRKRIIDAEGALSFTLENVSGLGRRYATPYVKGRTGLFRPDWYYKGENINITTEIN